MSISRLLKLPLELLKTLDFVYCYSATMGKVGLKTCLPY